MSSRSQIEETFGQLEHNHCHTALVMELYK